MTASQLPIRSEEHIIDTCAVRTVIQNLPENLLIRSLEERDYGIDMYLELFDGNKPTGGMALVQIKGLKKTFNWLKKKDAVSMSFPKHTIEYSLLFDFPVFIFYTSVSEKKTLYIWLQKYVDTRLGGLDGKWRRTSGKERIYFPRENSLVDSKDKLIKIIKEYQTAGSVMQILEIVDHFRRFAHNVLEGKGSGAESCIEHAKRLINFTVFFEENYFEKGLIQQHSLDLVRLFNLSPGTKKTNKKRVRAYNEIMEEIDIPLYLHLGKRASDRVDVKNGWSIPY